MATTHLRSRVRWTLAALVVIMLVLALRTHHHASGEPNTAAQLTQVATAFNHDYQVGHMGAVWDRYDARSRAVISRARDIRWHQECPTPPGAATTTGVVQEAGGWWMVDYTIDGVMLHDFWHQEQGQWRFSLARSNPTSVALYSSSFQKFAHAVGCGAG